VQGAGNGRQQVDAPLAPLGVSATQESDSGVPQSENEYKGLDELLGKAKRGRVGHRNGTTECGGRQYTGYAQRRGICTAERRAGRRGAPQNHFHGAPQSRKRPQFRII